MSTWQSEVEDELVFNSTNPSIMVQTVIRTDFVPMHIGAGEWILQRIAEDRVPIPHLSLPVEFLKAKST